MKIKVVTTITTTVDVTNAGGIESIRNKVSVDPDAHALEMGQDFIGLAAVTGARQAVEIFAAQNHGGSALAGLEAVVRTLKMESKR